MSNDTASDTDINARDTTGHLMPRNNVKVSDHIVIGEAYCPDIVNSVEDIALTLASKVKLRSDENECADTEAKIKTIGNALLKYFKKEGYIVCGTQCLRLIHSGDWHGWLKVGPKAHFDTDAYSGAHWTFDDCISGGKGDL